MPTVPAVKKKYIKCLVWDLDHTLWHGVLLEDDRVVLRDNIRSIIDTLDGRGILQSIASKNDYAAAMRKLQEFDLRQYYLYPQIGWSSKVEYIKKIAAALNIGLEAFAFIDDEPFERAEVLSALPTVLCLDAAAVDGLLDLPAMQPRFITGDSGRRRQMYRNDLARNEAQEQFVGPKEEFLASLAMKFHIFKAAVEDLQRAEELTVRTNQLNSTGYSYSFAELDRFRQSDQYLLLMAALEDRFGDYGHIGLALIERRPAIWTIRLLLMSCRVMSRGVGTIMLNHIMNLARQQRICLRAEFMPNGRNRMMDITYRLAGFKQVGRVAELLILENDLRQVHSFPAYVEVKISE